jgi:hypothetical protein
MLQVPRGVELSHKSINLTPSCLLKTYSERADQGAFEIWISRRSRANAVGASYSTSSPLMSNGTGRATRQVLDAYHP